MVSMGKGDKVSTVHALWKRARQSESVVISDRAASSGRARDARSGYFPSAFRSSVLADSTSRGAAWQSKSARNLSP
jgi:hypothetical protein